MAQLDQGAKIALRVGAADLAAAAGLQVAGPQPISPEVVVAEFRADGVLVATTGRARSLALQFEFEAEPSSGRARTIARRAALLEASLDLRVVPVVYYLHPSRDRRRPARRCRLRLGLGHAEVRFAVVVAWEDLHAERILKSASPGLLPFAGLSRGGTLEVVADASRAIRRLRVAPDMRSELLASLYLLSGYAFSGGDLMRIIGEEQLMESTTYRETLERGLARGLAKGLEKGQERGLRRSLILFLSARGLSLPSVEPRLDQLNIEQLVSLETHLFAAHDQREILSILERDLPPHRCE